MFLSKEIILDLSTKNISFEDFLFKNFLKKNIGFYYTPKVF